MAQRTTGFKAVDAGTNQAAQLPPRRTQTKLCTEAQEPQNSSLPGSASEPKSRRVDGLPRVTGFKGQAVGAPVRGKEPGRPAASCVRRGGN